MKKDTDKLTNSDFWKEISRLSMSARERAFDQYQIKIEDSFNCKIVDRAYGDLGSIDNPVMPVLDSIRNICYLKEFVPNSEAEPIIPREVELYERHQSGLTDEKIEQLRQEGREDDRMDEIEHDREERDRDH